MNGNKIIHSHIPGFTKLLAKVDSQKVSSQAYCCKYLQYLIDHAPYYLTIYACVLEKILEHASIPRQDMFVIDIGAGNGLLGIFAKYCGFGKIVLNDTDPRFMEASRQLSLQLQIPIDGFVNGDIGPVKAYCADEKPVAIIGTDVIEHIYNLSHFFNTVAAINPAAITVFTTAANPENYLKVRQLRKLQLKDENAGGTPDDFILFGNEPHGSFQSMREKIIREHGNGFDEKLVKEFVKRTRGLNKQDIISSIEHYKSFVKLPELMVHSTNTCNPLTGSWTERVLSLEEYNSLYIKNNFRLIVDDGFYNEFRKGIKGKISLLLNKIISIFGHRFAPFLILTGYKK